MRKRKTNTESMSGFVGTTGNKAERFPGTRWRKAFTARPRSRDSILRAMRAIEGLMQRKILDRISLLSSPLCEQRWEEDSNDTSSLRSWTVTSH